MQYYILHRDDDGQIVKQPHFREEPTETPELLLALTDFVMALADGVSERHAI